MNFFFFRIASALLTARYEAQLNKFDIASSCLNTSNITKGVAIHTLDFWFVSFVSEFDFQLVQDLLSRNFLTSAIQYIRVCQKIIIKIADCSVNIFAKQSVQVSR